MEKRGYGHDLEVARLVSLGTRWRYPLHCTKYENKDIEGIQTLFSAGDAER